MAKYKEMREVHKGYETGTIYTIDPASPYIGDYAVVGILNKEQIENLRTRQLLTPMFHWIGLCDVTTRLLTIGHNLVGQPIKLVEVTGFGKCYLKVNMTKHDFGKGTVTKEIQLIKAKD